MIAIWGSKEHITYVFPLWFSHDGQKSLKNVPKPSKNTSLLSAQAGIYIITHRCLHVRMLRPSVHKRALEDQQKSMELLNYTHAHATKVANTATAVSKYQREKG